MKNIDPLMRLQQAREQSELLRGVAKIRRDGGLTWALEGGTARGLTGAEVAQLERQGNLAQDWSRVRVAGRFDPGAVQQSSFHGDVVIGELGTPVRLEAGLELPSGIYRSTLVDCVIGHQALVRDVRMLARTVVGPQAQLLDCGSILCTRATSFGTGAHLPVGIETGGRFVPIYAEIDIEVATQIAIARGQVERLEKFCRAVQEYAQQAESPWSIIERGAQVRHTSQVVNCYVGPHARVIGAAAISDSCLLSSAEEPVRIEDGALVKSSVIQWASQVRSMSIVENSVLMEHAHAERHGKVLASIVGPNSGIAEGEVNSCLLGPFVGFHHQALLIAAVWPEGKGNVAYGANVGSNHTSRAPDQEFWPGEGAYLGLGVNIKYPSDFRRAPYTIVAMGVETLPQKLEFPFSLINKPWGPCPTVSPAYNEILPAWVLTDNPYMLKRNEGKYRSRNQARRTEFDFTIFRPDIVDLMIQAVDKLEVVEPLAEFYTDREIAGLGKNILREPNRLNAIAGYRFYIQYYALLGLKQEAQALVKQGQAEQCLELLRQPSRQPVWEHQRKVLTGWLGIGDMGEALTQLPGILKQIARSVEHSKHKDDERGSRIIDGYAETHPPASQDALVKQTWEETARLEAEIIAILESIGKTVSV